MTLESAYQALYTVVLCVLGLLLFLSLIRSVLGPRIADRIVAVNMIGTITICIVCVLALKLGESYLADVALVYAMISFLAVVVLCKVYTGIYRERKHEEERLRAQERGTEADK